MAEIALSAEDVKSGVCCALSFKVLSLCVCMDEYACAQLQTGQVSPEHGHVCVLNCRSATLSWKHSDKRVPTAIDSYMLAML